MLFQPETGRDVTGMMVDFAGRFLDSVGAVDGFILKSRSPSCGIKDVKVFPSAEAHSPAEKANGFFAAAVVDRFASLPVEDEGRLSNFSIREHFLTGIFALAAFRKVQESGRMKDVVRFQSENKLLLMAYNQKELRELGRITANPERRPVGEVIGAYREHLLAALARAPRYTSNINVLMHALGYFSKKLGRDEKAFFLDTLERYREGKIPLSACLSVVRSWIARFGEPYLDAQSYFEPYPVGLVEITDSGKGRKL